MITTPSFVFTGRKICLQLSKVEDSSRNKYLDTSTMWWWWASACMCTYVVSRTIYWVIHLYSGVWYLGCRESYEEKSSFKINLEYTRCFVRLQHFSDMMFSNGILSWTLIKLIFPKLVLENFKRFHRVLLKIWASAPMYYLK